ncbi:MAG TPA: D-alanyl-D-alanine carboxypeptidase family protein [Stellaceae bacterium]|jgi:D-alanyl-D-alanine carboxypeptidase (penicillin-binding protein 5/6)|nr:D-alanyl-D-alanine carboxypeptidase family protein [Stellaceae bacterium]
MKARWRQSIAAAVASVLLVLPMAAGSGIAAQTKPVAARAPTAPAAKPNPAAPAPPPSATFDTSARFALITEADTGTVLFAKNPDERMAPASMSKLMTAYVVFSMLKDGRITLGDDLPVSEKAWKLGGSKMFVGIGGRIKIDDLVRGMIVQSGNDACVVLAEGLAGSEDAFVELMNQKAQQIGLKNSHFANVTGLPDPNEWMTVRDLTTLGLHLIHDFPEYYHYFSEKDFNFNNIDQGNRNPLLYKNLGADGLKTGHTDESGYSLIGSVVRGERRVIVVVSGLASMKDRASESERLIEWAFREYADYKLFSAGEKVDDANVWLGQESRVGLTIADDLTVTLPRRSRHDMKVTVNYDDPVPAPVKKGDAIGKLTITTPGADTVERPLYAAADVQSIGTIGRMATLAGYLIWGTRH